MGTGIRTSWAAGEKIAFSTDNKRSDGVFDFIVIDRNVSILEIGAQLWPQPQVVSDGLTQRTFR